MSHAILNRVGPSLIGASSTTWEEGCLKEGDYLAGCAVLLPALSIEPTTETAASVDKVTVVLYSGSLPVSLDQ